MESHSRMFARNWFPRPSPLLAPFTRPAMSTNSTLVGMIFSLPEMELQGEAGEGRAGQGRAGQGRWGERGVGRFSCLPGPFGCCIGLPVCR